MVQKPRRIGLDLDNTVIDYGPAVERLAKSEGFLGVNTVGELRSQIKTDNNFLWQFMQSKIYVAGLDFAVPAKNLLDLLLEARLLGVQVFLVSHKTEFTPEEFGGHDLRTPALDWLSRWGITPELVPLGRVFFESTQQAKIERLCQLNLDWFIDDLREILTHDDFPTSTAAWYYDPDNKDAQDSTSNFAISRSGPQSVNSFLQLIDLLRTGEKV